jgi:hypothetical protein
MPLLFPITAIPRDLGDHPMPRFRAAPLPLHPKI